MCPSPTAVIRRILPAIALAMVAGPVRAEAPAARAGEGTFEVELRTVPQRIVLGEGEAVTFEVSAPEPPGPLRPLQASVNVGTLDEVQRLSPGRYSIAYSPPRARYPQVAIVAVWREQGHRAPVAFFRVPLIGNGRVPVDTAPDATVWVSVAGRRFGPFRANAEGVAMARYRAPPGVPSAKVTATDGDGRRSSARLPLDVPPYNRLTLAVVPHAIVADGVDPARLYLYYDDAGGRPPPPEDLALSAAVGSVGEVQALEGAVYAATYRAPPGVPDQRVLFRAEVRGDRASHAGASISLGRQVPHTVEIDPPDAPLVADGVTPARLRVSVLDALGLGVAGHVPAVTLSPPEAGTTAIEAVGQGTFEVTVVPHGRPPDAAELGATLTVAAGPVAGRATLRLVPPRPARVEVEPSSLRLRADGASAALLDVRVLDARGRPVAGARPRVRAGRGTVSWTPEGRLRYAAPRIRVGRRARAGEAPRPDRIVVDAGTARAAIPVELMPEVRSGPGPEAWAEVGLGWRRAASGLSGASARFGLGATVLGTGPLRLGLGVGWGLDHLAGSEGAGGGTVRLVSAPLLAEARVGWFAPAWDAGLGAGAGFLVLSGTRDASTGGDVPIGALRPAWGGRLWAASRMGPGRLVIEASWILADPGPDAERLSGLSAVTGPGATLGYRLEL